ncbi:MAG: arsenate reductase family protein [Bacteroidales bacterium]|nr:arsenate reductase family protein [Bacteroidales bacterium]
MKPLFVQYPKCGTCQKAAKWLKSNNIDTEIRDITIENPTREELKLWIAQSGLPIQKFFNTSGLVYKDLNLKDKVKTASTDELLDLLASNGKLVKRPVFVKGDEVLVGFKEEEWNNLFVK